MIFYLPIYIPILFTYILFSFLWACIDSKTMKIFYMVTICMQSYPMNSYWFSLIKNYYICFILHLRYIVFRLKTFEFGFILIVCLYFKIIQRIWWHEKSSPTLLVSSPARTTPSLARITPLLAGIFPNKLGENKPINHLLVILLHFQ